MCILASEARCVPSWAGRLIETPLIRDACDARPVVSGAMDRCLGKPYRSGMVTS
ncbi:hypothetical protein BU25DRAFT_412111 [Macroventuria anomochaeta]|uniref:Uncharacterized protein n=1 Tax=Macroventuria anomochaeta TaxID=301207 RepID=A0ACB6RVQ0_9PLEO|nr:uncharacterized protein BU25DRAFT_412111 [Macroventuria anomochaeta]KAF2625849.1 hypothetical protein BU25DRAFT_412111 [Macroventuria anomochaeta]